LEIFVGTGARPIPLPAQGPSPSLYPALFRFTRHPKPATVARKEMSIPMYASPAKRFVSDH
jgi:hypothetical protein